MEMEFSDSEAPSTEIPVPPTLDPASLLTAHGSTSALIVKEKEESNLGLHDFAGYIFLCNRRTKSECYRYRVFGLPKGRKDFVGKIKPGMKLFLFDFERKLLYGIYESTTGGQLNMEPDAFNGKFPVQVGFRICKDCYPLHESSFRPAIQDNYKGAKFKQELSAQQVTSLLSLFRSFTAPPLEMMPLRLASLSSPTPVKLSGLEHNRFYPQTMVSSLEEQHLRARQLKHASSVLDSQFVHQVERHGYSHGQQSLPSHVTSRLLAQGVSSAPHGYGGQTSYVKPPTDLDTMSNLNQQDYSLATQWQHLQQDPTQPSVQEPHLKYMAILSNIRRYGTAQEPVSNDQHLISANEYYPLPSWGNEYYPSASSGNENYASASSGNEYYPSTSSGNEYYPSTVSQSRHYPSTMSGNGYYSSSSASGNEYYPSRMPVNEYYPSASQREGESVQQPEMPAANYYNNQLCTASHLTEPVQSNAEATWYTPQSVQSHAEAMGYTPQSVQSQSAVLGTSRQTDWNPSNAYH